MWLFYLSIYLSKKHRLVLFCWKCSFGFISRAWREYVLLDYTTLKYGNREMIKTGHTKAGRNHSMLNVLFKDFSHLQQTNIVDRQERQSNQISICITISCCCVYMNQYILRILTSEVLNLYTKVALGRRTLSHLLTLIYVYVTSTVRV